MLNLSNETPIALALSAMKKVKWCETIDCIEKHGRCVCVVTDKVGFEACFENPHAGHKGDLGSWLTLSEQVATTMATKTARDTSGRINRRSLCESIFVPVSSSRWKMASWKQQLTNQSRLKLHLAAVLELTIISRQCKANFLYAPFSYSGIQSAVHMT